MTKKLTATVMLSLLAFPWAAQAQSFNGFGFPFPFWGGHSSVSAPEMPNYGMLAAALCGLAAYIVLRRRYASVK